MLKLSDSIVVCIEPGYSSKFSRAGGKRLMHILRMCLMGGAEVSMFTMVPLSGERGEIVQGVPVRSFCANGEKSLLAFKFCLRAYKALKAMRLERPQKKLVLYYSAGLRPRLLFWYCVAKKLRAPLIGELNEFPPAVINGYSALRRKAEEYLVRFLDAGVIMTKNLQTYYEKIACKGFSDILLPMTVDSRPFEEEKRPNPFGFDYIAYTGCMTRLGGGVDILVNAFSLLATEFPDIHLVLMGGADKNLAKKLLSAVSSKIASRIHIFNERVDAADIPMCLKNAKILAALPLPTKQQEGCFPTKLGEYLACGIPTVISQVGNPAHCLEDGNQVFFVPPDNASATAEVMRRILKDYKSAMVVAREGQAYAKRSFDFSNYANELGSWMKGVLEQIDTRRNMRYGFRMAIHAGLCKMSTKVHRIFQRIYSRMICLFWGIDAGKGVLFNGPVFVRTRNNRQVSLGENVRFNSTIRSNAVGLTNPTIIDVRFGGKIKVGDRSGFSAVVLSSKSYICIGRDVYVGGNVRIFDHDFHPLKPEDRRCPIPSTRIRSCPIVIGDEVFIGTNAIILKGTRIGDRSIIAAGSVVFGLDIPPDSMVRGNPAVICGRRHDK